MRKTKIQVRELQIWSDRFLSSEEYRENLKGRILAGEAQAIELALYHYAYGKPKEELKVSGGGDGVFILNIGGVEVVRRELQDGEIINGQGELADSAGSTNGRPVNAGGRVEASHAIPDAHH